MEQTKHTPGPQPCQCGKKPSLITIAAKAQIWCSDETGCGRRSIRCGSIKETIADWNRQTAAPDLLEALQLLETAARRYVTTNDSSESYVLKMAEKARAAIAKAEPKS